VAAQAHGVLERTGLTAEQTDQAAWTVVDDETRVGGPKAIALMLSTAWGTRVPMLPLSVPGVTGVLERVYEWIATNRGRFPGSTPWCVAHPGACSPE